MAPRVDAAVWIDSPAARVYVQRHQVAGRRGRTLRALADKYGGLVTIAPGVYLISEPDLIEEILVARPGKFHKGRTAQRMAAFFGRGSLLLEGDAWRSGRQTARQRRANHAAALYYHRCPSGVDRIGILDQATVWVDLVNIAVGIAIPGVIRVEIAIAISERHIVAAVARG